MAAVLLLPLALGGCSDDDGPAAGAASARPSASVSPPAAPSAAPSAGPSPVPSSATGRIASSAALPLPSPDLTRRLTGDGLDLPTGVVAFGDPLSAARPALLRFLGRPTKDTGAIAPVGDYGACPPPDLRVLEYAGGALQLYFHTPAGGREPAFASWVLTGDRALPQASALVGDVTTFEFGPGTTLRALQEGLGEALVLVQDEVVGPAFRVRDQSSGFYGQLSSTGLDGVVEAVQAGEGCGE